MGAFAQTAEQLAIKYPRTWEIRLVKQISEV